MKWNQQPGFTLVEMAVTVAVAGVLAAAALPSLANLQRSQVLDSYAEALRSDLRLARTEAVRRAETVTVCARDDVGTGCAGTRSEWRNGWLVFVDRGARGVLEPGDRLLRVYQPVGVQGPVQTTLAYLSFQPSGISLNAASHFRFLAHGDDPAAPRAGVLVCVNKIGRSRITPDEACA